MPSQLASPARWFLPLALALAACGRMGFDSTLVVGTEAPDAAPTMNGNGLLGHYYNRPDLTDLALTRIDPQIDFEWVSASPAPGIVAEDFSVAWTGQVEARSSEPTTFYAFIDDGARLWIGGVLLIDSWGSGPQTLTAPAITLVAGRRYDLRMELVDYHYHALAHLSWSTPTMKKEIVPSSQLYPSDR
jgi:hypothetical protein